ncbi:response regulator transcription factor [Paenibacillus caseinilyticus]|uniref:AraC family transcriptional regulator n=1 Tax=Paenibacillus mucilaginosus K02 TaxID=997761 RepID=I0BLE3_9BACL|nr:response regulator [Paenibacillus mucilaginosus]AFH63190.1 AraC family transcriptional regulator [Paenibacillus mucilaginosus K02]
MYKLLIIDDEPIIRQGLRSIIDWERYDIRLCGEADNGIDGLRLCGELAPDLVIIDVKMPGLDGLEVIEEARAKGLVCDFIVLSGYSEFSYAQKATEFGVRSYLLKPVEQEDLVKRVDMLRKEWEMRKKERERQDESIRLLMERKLHSLFQMGSEHEMSEEEYGLLAAGLKLPWSSYQVLLIGDERRELEMSEREWILSRLSGSCSPDDRAAVFSYQRVVGILAEALDGESLWNPCFLDGDDQLGLELVYAIGPRVLKLEQISHSFRKAYDEIGRKFFCSRSDRLIVPRDDASCLDADPASFRIEICADETAKAVASGDTEAISVRLKEAESVMLKGEWSEERVKASFAALYNELVKNLKGVDESIQSVCPLLHEVIEGIERQPTLAAVREYMEEQLLPLVDRWSKERKPASFMNILHYIAQHYSSDLKLETLAELFHYNRSYLGKLFKSQTGDPFNTYLHRVRIEKAKQKLAAGAKVYETADAVGYASVDYFHIKFKEYAGETPSAYADKWRYKAD